MGNNQSAQNKPVPHKSTGIVPGQAPVVSRLKVSLLAQCVATQPKTHPLPPLHWIIHQLLADYVPLSKCRQKVQMVPPDAMPPYVDRSGRFRVTDDKGPTLSLGLVSVEERITSYDVSDFDDASVAISPSSLFVACCFSNSILVFRANGERRQSIAVQDSRLRPHLKLAFVDGDDCVALANTECKTPAITFYSVLSGLKMRSIPLSLACTRIRMMTQTVVGAPLLILTDRGGLAEISLRTGHVLRTAAIAAIAERKIEQVFGTWVSAGGSLVLVTNRMGTHVVDTMTLETIDSLPLDNCATAVLTEGCLVVWQVFDPAQVCDD